MKYLVYLTVGSIVVLLLTSCGEGDGKPLPLCDQEVIVSVEAYESAESDFISVNNLRIINDCLYISLSASGCDGSSWEFSLIDSGGVFESLPPQRNLFLSLNNPELCEAFLTKEIAFDISAIQVEGHSVLLNITNTEDVVSYVY